MSPSASGSLASPGDRNDLARTLAEREAVIEAQRREIHSLRDQLRIRKETGMTFRMSK